MADPAHPDVVAAADPSAELTVRAVLLDAAGVHPEASEIRALARAYPGVRRQVEALYRVPTGDDAPVTMLRAELDS